jgi:hypothetical protein
LYGDPARQRRAKQSAGFRAIRAAGVAFSSNIRAGLPVIQPLTGLASSVLEAEETRLMV